MIDLKEIQKQASIWSIRNFGLNKSKRTDQELYSIAPLLGVAEEVGELCHAQLKSHQGIRGFDDVTKRREYTKDAVGDILIYLMDFCAREGLEMQDCLLDTWGEVKKRNWGIDDTDSDLYND